MKVRVVEAHERRTLAWLVALGFGLLTLCVLSGFADLESVMGWDRPWSYGVPSMLWNLGLVLGFRRQPYLANVGTLVASQRTPATRLEVGVARAERGCSIAVSMRESGRAPKFYFFEVEREADARRVVESDLQAKWPGQGVTMKLRHDGYSMLQRIIALAGAVCGFLYGFFVSVLHAPDFKAIFGIPALVFGLIASVMFIVDPLMRRLVLVGKQTINTKGAVSQHLLTHAINQIEHAKAAHGDEQHLDARIRVLDRGADEASAAWLARIDAMGEKKEGYRDAAFSDEDLERVARDPRLPAHARLGATRLLLRRAPEAAEAMRFRITTEDDADPALEQKARVVLRVSDPREAAEELENLGPAYRAGAR